MPYSESSYPVIWDSRTNEGVRAAIQKIITRSTDLLSTCFDPLLLLTWEYIEINCTLSWMSDFPRILWWWCLLLVWQVSNQDWKCRLPNMGEFGAADHFPRLHLLSWSGAGHQDLLRVWPATTSQQAGRPVNGTFPSFYGRSIPWSWSK